jgi:uncharacterized protein YdhG (YjbR/CyaY superfamily)
VLLFGVAICCSYQAVYNRSKTGGESMAEKAAEVDGYMRDLTPDRRAALERIRSLIFATVPNVTETMRYRMPTYELNDVVCSVASQKHYMSLYMDTTLVAQHKEELKHLDVGKSCIRFRRIEDLPLTTVKRILEETVQAQSARQ